MTTSELQKKQAIAFLDVLTKDVSDGRQRPSSYHTINAIDLLGLKIGKGHEAWAGLSRLEAQDQIHAFLYIQRAPLPDVSKAVRYFVRQCDEIDEATGDPVRTRQEAWEDFILRYIEPFLAEISAEALVEAFEEIQKLGEVIPISAVPPDNHKPERPDPNS